jgi:hypothetical protein
MRKIHVLSVALVATLAFGAMNAAFASAATLQWLAGGVKITEPLASETVGELEFVDTSTIIGTEVGLLCSGIFDGTVGPGTEDMLAELLNLSKEKIELGVRLITCTVTKGTCGTATVAFENLPWLTELELMGTEAEPLFLDKILTGGKGEPGFLLHCTSPLSFEEACLGAASSDLENDPLESDVLGGFIGKELVGKCNSKTTATGFISTENDGPLLWTLVNKEPLSVSYE